jgi:hypothetical protein
MRKFTKSTQTLKGAESAKVDDLEEAPKNPEELLRILLRLSHQLHSILEQVDDVDVNVDLRTSTINKQGSSTVGQLGVLVVSIFKQCCWLNMLDSIDISKQSIKNGRVFIPFFTILLNLFGELIEVGHLLLQLRDQSLFSLLWGDQALCAVSCTFLVV